MEERGMSAVSVVTRILERWRVLTLAAVLAAAVTVAAVVFLVPRRYQASTTLAAVSAPQLPSGLGGIAALSGLTADVGFAATPDLLAQLLESRRVLLDVAESPVVEGSPERVIDRVRAGEEPAERLVDVERSMRALVSVDVERRTSLITLAVRHRHSTVARIIAE